MEPSGVSTWPLASPEPEAHGRRRWVVAAAAHVGAIAMAEHDRWPLWTPVGLGAGIALYFALPAEPPTLLGPLVVASLAVLWALARRPGGAAVRLVAVPLLVIASGFALAQMRTALVAAPVLARSLDYARLEGRIVVNAAAGKGHRIVLDEVRIAGLATAATPERVRIRVYGDAAAALRPGDRVRLAAGLRPPPGPSSPGGFDFARRAYFQRLGAVGFALGRAERIGEREGGGLAAAIARLRRRVTARLTGGLDGDAGALAAALLTGERGAIAPDVLTAMRNAGLAHLLAISGLHMGLVTFIVFAAVRGVLAAIEPVALRFPIKKWAAVAALLAAFGYLLLSGAAVPTQRAFLMVALLLLAVLVDRMGLTMRAVAWAATVLLVLAPESLLGASFQLSFAAVTGLVAFWEAVSARRSFDGPRTLGRRVGLYLAGVAATTLVANLATAPFVVAAFDRIAVYGLAANVVAVPLTALWIMPFGVAALALMPLGLEGLALAPMGWGLDAVVAVAREVASWPAAVAHVAAMPALGFALAVVGGLWLTLWQGRWRWFGLAAFALGALSPVLAQPPDLWVDGKGRLFALRHDDALVVSSSRVGRYAAAQWQRRAGLDRVVGVPDDAAWLRCDRLGCIATIGGRTLAIARDGRALAEDCRRADVVVSLVPVRHRCPAAVIDRFDLWREGAHTLRLAGGRVIVDSVGRHRGTRPWSRGPAR